MPIIKSAIKRARQSLVHRSRNLKVKRAIHDDVREVLDAAASGDAAATAEKMRQAQSEIDRAVKKGVLHRNTAARRKSRLIKTTQSTLGTATPAKKPAAKKATTAKKPTAKKPAAKKAPAKKAA